MEYTDVQTIALAILTSIITGGFVLVFVEIGNRKNRENDKHEHIITPFYHKLSAYFRFINWCSGYIHYPKPLEGYEGDFKSLVKELSNYGGRAIVSGGDYGIDFFSADKLNDIATKINNIWYYHDKMHPCRLTWNTQTRGTEEFVQKELREVNPLYLGKQMDVALVAKVSGEFYTDIYQPIEYETYRHEIYQEHYKRQTGIVIGFVCFVLLLLGLMLFVTFPKTLLQMLTVLVIMMLFSSLLMLAVDADKQIKWWNKIEDNMEKAKKKSIKESAGRFWKDITKGLTIALQYILKKMIIIGLLLSAWAILSIEISWIPLIEISESESVVDGLNNLFLALAYSYVAGVIIYLFTVVFPQFEYKTKMSPVIKDYIKDIGSCLNNMLLEFCVGNGEARNPNLDDLEDCKSLIINGNWAKVCGMPSHNGMMAHQAFKQDFTAMISSINIFVDNYKDVLTTKQLLLIEKIRRSSILPFIDFGGNLTSDYSVAAKEYIARFFCEIVQSYQELKATV